MAKTVSLNSDNSVYVTTFYNSKIEGGRCYDFTVNLNGIQVAATVTDAQLIGMLILNGGNAIIDDGVRPEFH